MVLGTAVIVTILGLSALTAVRIQRRSAGDAADFAEARRYARSAIEMGLHTISSDEDWRQNQASGNWVTKENIGRGTYSLDGVDPVDGDLAVGGPDPLVLTGIGEVGEARCRLSVQLVALIEPLTCLEAALHAGDIVHNYYATVQCDQKLSSNSEIHAEGASVYGDVEVVDDIWGWTYHGSQTSGITPRTMPDSTVFDYYLANGTVIDFWSIPEIGFLQYIQDQVISPASNPFGGTTNPEGIYIIDCAGQSIIIENSRIVGTLVLLDPGGNSTVDYSVNWEPAVANYPALLVDGDMYFSFFQDTLDEDDRSTNFNPPGTPYQGDADTDTDDAYRSVIKGIVYVSDDVESWYDPRFEGVVIVGDEYWIWDTLDLTYSDVFLNDPPPGFQDPNPPMVVQQGTWRQVVD